MKSNRINKKPLLFRFGLKKEVYSLIQSLAELLSAGIVLSESLKIIREESGSRRVKKILGRILSDIDQGYSFSLSLEQEKIIPLHILSFIKSGEESGKLADNLKVISAQNEKEMLFKAKVNSALTYAILIFTITIIVGVGSAWYSLPKITGIYSQMNIELPVVTRFLVMIGKIMTKYGFLIIPAFISIVITAFYFLFSFPQTRFIGHTILFRTPIIKRLIMEVEISRSFYILGTMIESGIPASRAISTLPQATTFNNYKRFFKYLSESISEGNSLKQSIDNYKKTKKLFPAAVRQILISSEKTGTLGQSLLRIGNMYENKASITLKNLPTLLEPLILLFLGVGIAIFAIGTIMPIYNMVYTI